MEVLFFYCFSVWQTIEKGVVWGYNKKEKVLKSKKELENQIMKKPVLVIMAAGMGSRYGGLKQIDPVDKEGHIIMDFSLFDAKRAGFEKVILL